MEDRADAGPVYTMLYRPVSSFTLPRGVTTEWRKLPRNADGHMMRAFPALVRSEHAHGEFTTSRELSAEEMQSYQVKRIDPAFMRRERIEELDRQIETLETERCDFTSDADEVTALTQEIDQANVEREKLLADAAG